MTIPIRMLSARELEIIERMQAIAGALPEAETGVDGFGHTTFKVNQKSFVLIGGGLKGEASLSIKADPTTQSLLVQRGPYIRAPYIGQHGWVTLWGDQEFDWDEIAQLAHDAYRLVAPKRLLKQQQP